MVSCIFFLITINVMIILMIIFIFILMKITVGFVQGVTPGNIGLSFNINI
jgi:hypothetical protein